jgi:small conductance mechanosensitive channel
MSQEQIDVVIGYVTEYGLKLIIALLILLVGKWMAGLARSGLRKAMTRAKVDPTLIGFLSNIAFYLIMVAVVIAAVSQVGIQTTSFVAVLGAAGLAIGLSLQGSLSNFASGVLIILFRPFKVGDFVEAGGVMGTVDEIGILTTQMHTPDNKGITVPNSQIMSTHIVNFNTFDTRRCDMTFGISYRDDIDRAKAILADMVANDPRCFKDPAPTIVVGTLGESSVDILCRPWCKASDYWGIFWDMQEAVKKRFDAEGISIPFPQRDVHLHTVEKG